MPMRVAITGSSGLIGTALVRALEASGNTVTRLRRGRDYDPSAIDGQDAIVHLAGESIVGLWTSGKKRRIRDSRINGTSLLATSILKSPAPPRLFVSASAIGYYGERGNEPLDESASKGTGFLSDVTEAWEKAAAPIKQAGIRTAHMRFGLVLSDRGGALRPMLPLFKAGLGGRLGSGKQIWSWVALDDVVGSILYVLTRESLAGPINVTAPQAVTNLAFTRTLGRVLRRPTIAAVPQFVLNIVGGQMAHEMLLSSARVVPRKLTAAGYEFSYPELEVALRHVLADDR